MIAAFNTKVLLSIFAAGIFLMPQQAGSATFDNRFALSCAGLYGLLEQAHRELGDEENRRFYNERFQVLGTIVENDVLREGGTKQSARDLVVARAEITMGAIALNPSIQALLTKNCDDGYEETVRNLGD